jgi:hypothetical protein
MLFVHHLARTGGDEVCMIRACIRDPDGHLIEVGQTTARPDAP